MSPNTYSLVSVSARPDKRSIHATFANTQKKVLKQYPFFPSFYLPRTSTTVFETLLRAQPASLRHQVMGHPKSIQVLAGTWEDLKQLAQRLYAQTGYFPSLIEPERQFLLAQNWNYFQAFDEKLTPLNEAYLDALIPGLAENVHPTLRALRTHKPEMEKNLTQRMVLSHELSIPYTDVPLAQAEQLEILLSNALFALQMPAPHTKGSAVNTSTWSMEQRTRANALVFHTPLTETEGKCACCAPTSIFHQNVHAGSLIDARATQDGVYIHTNHAGLSGTYHEKNPGKEKRLARAQEWGLSTLPIGPLRRGEKIALPLREAIEGQRQGILDTDQPPGAATWTCRKEPLALEQLKGQLDRRIALHTNLHGQLVQPYLRQYQLAYTLHTTQDPRVGLHQATEKTLKEWANALPLHLLRGETVWRGAGYTALIQAGIGE